MTAFLCLSLLASSGLLAPVPRAAVSMSVVDKLTTRSTPAVTPDEPETRFKPRKQLSNMKTKVGNFVNRFRTKRNKQMAVLDTMLTANVHARGTYVRQPMVRRRRQTQLTSAWFLVAARALFFHAHTRSAALRRARPTGRTTFCPLSAPSRPT